MSVARLDVDLRTDSKEMCLKEIRLCVQILSTILNLIVNVAGYRRIHSHVSYEI
jgi:hypothetical protein